ncbi:MAG TPA: membrane dipeptidase, partial [Gemmatimonadales bacterium]|nr:membrane dipeptidase [Gemmatimonadales bacterium]
TQGADPIKNLIVVNALGGLDEGYAPPPPGPPAVMSPGALAAGKASGMTAINMTLAGGDDFETTVEAIAAYDNFIHANSDKLLKVYSTADILQAKKDGRIGVIYGFQNAAMMGDKVGRVDIFADLGVRCIQLTYNSLNQLGGGSMAPGNPGLTAFGREVVAKLNERRVMVDLSHSGQQICLDAARASATPISINHTGCKAIVDVPRNKTDEELKLVADKGGFVGIYFVMFLAQGREATIDDVVAHIEHALKVCGEDHVGIGSDYGIVNLGEMQPVRDYWAAFVRKRMENKSAATGEDPNILPFAQGLIGPDQFRSLYRPLEKRGHQSGVIEKVLGRNYMRFAKEIWGA